MIDIAQPGLDLESLSLSDKIEITEKFPCLINLLKGETVLQSLFFSGVSFTHLPDDLTVQGNLYLFGCRKLTSLPPSLFVNGNLDIRNCPNLPYRIRDDIPCTVTGTVYFI